MWKNLPFRGYIYIAVVLNVISILIILFLKGFLPPVLPLFYELPAGADQLTPTLGLFIAPATGVLITLVNLLICGLTKDIFLKKMLIVSAVFTSFLIIVAVIKIILLVGFF